MLKRRIWHWREKNQAQLLVDGERYFPAMLMAVSSAKNNVLLEFYFVSSGRLMNQLIEALLAAVTRGVVVCLLFDHFGARGLRATDRRRLLDAGVSLRFYNPLAWHKWNDNFSRDHRKMLLVDGQTAFIGGTGLTDAFLYGEGGAPPWHEYMLRVQGPVVEDWVRLFQRSWNTHPGQPVEIARQARPAGVARMRVATTEGIRQQQIKAHFRAQINQAQSRVWLVSAYFLPSWSIQRALRNAALRGVDVRLLLAGPLTDHPGIYHAARRYYKRLLVSGVRIYEYQPAVLHAKVGVCDAWVSVGSCNLDHWNLRWNLEANQEVVDAALTRVVCQEIHRDMQKSEEITLSQWLARPWYQRVLSFCWGYLNAVLLRLV